jgi:hypothetical protein
MSRFVFSDVARDGNGVVCQSATATVYLAGTTTLANVYVASSGGAQVNSVTTSATDGSYSFFVDQADYDGTQNFKVTVSLTGFTAFTLDNIVIQGLPFATISPTTANITTANITTANITTAAITTATGNPNFTGNPTFTASTITTANLTTISKTGAGIVSNLNSQYIADAGNGNAAIAANSTPTLTTIPIRNANKDLLDRNSNPLYGISGVSASGVLTYVASSDSASVDLDMGTVTAGDIIYVSTMSSISFTTAAVGYVNIGKNSGTASVSNGGNTVSPRSHFITVPGGVSDATPATHYFGVYLFVTASGTLHLFGAINEHIATVTGNQIVISAFFLKKQ